MKRLSPDQPSLRALLALVVIALQVIGALHFTLVRHGYSAALGGVVHVHASARAEQRSRAKAVAARTTAVTSDVPACAAELCPDANAPHDPAQRIESLFTGLIAFGGARLLSESAGASSESLRVILSAPKTSPPV